MASMARRYEQLLAWKDRNRFKQRFLDELMDVYPTLTAQKALLTLIKNELPRLSEQRDNGQLLEALFEESWRRVRDDEDADKPSFVLIAVNRQHSPR